jgi:predicted phage terminase large subunit-like protein
MGKRSKHADPSAIIGGRMKDNIIYLTVADIEKRHPDKIADDILEYHRRDPFNAFAIEEIQFQEYFKDVFEKEAHKRGLTMNVKGIKPNTDKDLRIITLQPWIKNGWIRFKKYGMGELKKQLMYYRPKGKGGHDDGPDALEMLKCLLESGMGRITYETVARRSPFKDEQADDDRRDNDRSGPARSGLARARGLW